jgi:capsid protein
MRLSALKEYEDAELTAAELLPRSYIKKGDGQSFEMIPAKMIAS